MSLRRANLDAIGSPDFGSIDGIRIGDWRTCSAEGDDREPVNQVCRVLDRVGLSGKRVETELELAIRKQGRAGQLHRWNRETDSYRKRLIRVIGSGTVVVSVHGEVKRAGAHGRAGERAVHRQI